MIIITNCLENDILLKFFLRIYCFRVNANLLIYCLYLPLCIGYSLPKQVFQVATLVNFIELIGLWFIITVLGVVGSLDIKQCRSSFFFIMCEFLSYFLFLLRLLRLILFLQQLCLILGSIIYFSLSLLHEFSYYLVSLNWDLCHRSIINYLCKVALNNVLCLKFNSFRYSNY
jgi:hypothetical protein